MVTVYFERGGYAEEVATFTDEATYIAVSPALESLAKSQGFDRVTESME